VRRRKGRSDWFTIGADISDRESGRVKGSIELNEYHDIGLTIEQEEVARDKVQSWLDDWCPSCINPIVLRADLNARDFFTRHVCVFVDFLCSSSWRPDGPHAQ
jgi:hypothetical protein